MGVPLDTSRRERSVWRPLAAMSAPKKTVSFPPPPTNSVLRQIPSEDGTVQEDPERRKSHFHNSFLSTTAGQIFDSFTKLYALLAFSIFVAIVFASPRNWIAKPQDQQYKIH